MSLDLFLILTLHTGLSAALGFLLCRQFAKQESPAKEIPGELTDLREKTQQKSYNILHRAIKQADSIMTAAELAGLKLFSKEKMESRTHAAAYKKRLDALEDRFRLDLATAIKQSDTEYQNLLARLSETFSHQMEKQEQSFETSTATLTQDASKKLSVFLSSLSQKIDAETTQAFAQTKEEIASYKARRLKIIDIRLVDLLSSILGSSLPATFSMKDHVDLIYKALEQAKKDHALD